MNKLLSVICPCFNEEKAIPIFYNEVNKIASKFDRDLDLEILFVDDGSSDDTLQIIRHLSGVDNRVRYVSFSRNFGKEAAMYAGLQKVKGDLIAVMDVDLQDPPSLLIKMLKYIDQGYDCVATRRKDRKGEPPVRSFFAKTFYKLINKISQTEIVDGARDFRLMTRQVVDSILSVSEYNRFSKGIFSWVGYKTKWISYENIERSAGDTKWSFWKLLLYSIDGIVAFSTVPLAISFLFGILFLIISLIIFVKNIILPSSASLFSSISSLVLFVSAIELICIGVIGQYLSKTYLESKKRPVYLVKEEN